MLAALYGSVCAPSVYPVFWPVSVSASVGRLPHPPCGESHLTPPNSGVNSTSCVSQSWGRLCAGREAWGRVCQAEMCVRGYVAEAMSEVRGRFRPIPALPLSSGLVTCLGPSGALSAPPAVCGPKALGGDCILSKNGPKLTLTGDPNAALQPVRQDIYCTKSRRNIADKMRPQKEQSL